ncbi:MAG: hypothetical protein NTY87_11470 [Planctomycetia bacterium]|nr:hypothetical protein [Planctomycetia bacterium]
MKTCQLHGALWCFSFLLAGSLAIAGTSATPDARREPSAEELAALIESLGDTDYSQREAAASQLTLLGGAAVDALLAATEISDDLEVALQARWLVDGIPLNAPHDSAEVTQLLERFRLQDFANRVQVMHQLLRVENDAGIEALARIVRLDRSTSGSRIAAALLVREWQPDDPFWGGICKRILTGLGGSTRPAAELLKALCAFSQAEVVGSAAGSAGATPDEAAKIRARSLEKIAATLAILERAGDAQSPVDTLTGNTGEDGSAGLNETMGQIFKRCQIQMLLAADRRDDAVSEVTQMLKASLEADSADDDQLGSAIAEMLIWACQRGLPEGADLVAQVRPQLLDSHPRVGYASALCTLARKDQPQNQARAEELADEAFDRSEDDIAGRLQAAMLLAKWGGIEWANREYRAVIDDPKTPSAQFALATILFSESLHDQERESEAAECLRKLVTGRAEGKGRGEGGQEPILQQLGRDPRSVKSRMYFFESCAALAKGDTIAQRKALEDSLRAYSKDVDSLIAIYKFPDNTPEQHAKSVARIKESLAHIQSEIDAVPDDTNGYNEYAWLVANTEGDLKKATQYAKHSLIQSFDSSSYLDTLAHCYAAAGNRAAAIRSQTLAQRQEPYNRTIGKNLERFRQGQ